MVQQNLVISGHILLRGVMAVCLKRFFKNNGSGILTTRKNQRTNCLGQKSFGATEPFYGEVVYVLITSQW